MFTGIIQAQGTVAQSTERGGDIQLGIDAGELVGRIDATRLAVGESVAVNGVCLTVVAFDAGRSWRMSHAKHWRLHRCRNAAPVPG